MSKAYFKKNMIVDTPFRYEVSNEDGTSPSIKKIEFKPANITQAGDKVNAEDINGIQENSIYEVEAIRVVEGVNEFYDIVIDGINDFTLFNAKLLIKFNETNAKVNPQLRILWNSLNKIYPIRFLNGFSDIQVNIGDLKKEYIGYINQVSNKFLIWDLYGANDNIYYTMAQAQADLSLKDGDMIETLGYYEKGDGGGHKRVYSVINNGTGVVCGIGFLIIVSKYTKAEWFGAKFDNTQDDSDYIQKALDYDCYLEFPKKTAKLTKRLIVPAYKKVKFNGTTFDGHFDDFMMVLQYSGYQFFEGELNLVDSSVTEYSQVLTQGIALGLGEGISVHKADLSNLTIRGHRLKKLFTTGSYCWTNEIGNLYANECGNNSNFAIENIAESNNLHFKNIEIESTPTFLGKGLNTHGFAITIDNCHIESVYNENGFVNDAEGISVNGGYIEQREVGQNKIINNQKGLNFNGVLINTETIAYQRISFQGCRFLKQPLIRNMSFYNCKFPEIRFVDQINDYYELPVFEGCNIDLESGQCGNFSEFTHLDKVLPYSSINGTTAVADNSEKLFSELSCKIIVNNSAISTVNFAPNKNILTDGKYYSCWAIVKTPASFTEHQLTVGFHGQNFENPSRGISIPANGIWYLVIILNTLPSQNCINFTLNKIGGGNPTIGQYSYIDAYGIGFNGVDFSNIKKENISKKSAKANGNFNGNGSVVINSKSNILSITFISTGRYRVNFIKQMKDDKYAVNINSSITTTWTASGNTYVNKDINGFEINHIENGVLTNASDISFSVY